MVNKPVRAQVKRLRAELGENTATFGARFARTGRTVEDWEQGRRLPDPLCQRLLDELDVTRAERPAKG
jgi:DNA-binding transcriptional regulator YiaG